MDVNGTKPIKTIAAQRVGSGKPVQGKLKSSQELTKGQEIRVASAPVEFNLSEAKPDKKTDLIRKRTNSLISVVNAAKESTAEIEKLAKSMNGIATQAGEDSLASSRRTVLEKEAQELVDAIANKASSIGNNTKIASNTEGEIRLEIEEEIGKALDSIFPDVAKDSFGIGQINFSKKETIVSVRTNIALAKERIEQLKTAVDSASGNLSKAMEELEIASQNQLASTTSVRELDKALELAGNTTGKILADPEKAIDSFKISSKAQELLRD